MAKRLTKSAARKSPAKRGAAAPSKAKGQGSGARNGRAAGAASKKGASADASKAKAKDTKRAPASTGAGTAKRSPARRSARTSTPPAAAVEKQRSADKKPSNGAVQVSGPAIEADRKSDLKAQFAKLSSATHEISGLKRSLNKNFYDVGLILNRIRSERLYEVKGYGSFESFVEREIDINKAVCLRSARIAAAIHRDEALAAGLERASAAIAALDGELESANLRPVGSPVGSVPLHKQ